MVSNVITLTLAVGGLGPWMQRQRPGGEGIAVGKLVPAMTLKSLDMKSTLKLGEPSAKPRVLIFGSCT